VAGVRRTYLGIYLNDHLPASVGGLALARRAAGSVRDTPHGPDVGRLVQELASDQQELLDIMRRLRVRRTRYKEAFALAAETLGRLKPNGAVVRRSALSSVVELEGIQVGVHAKLSCWLMLRHLAATERALATDSLDGLIATAEGQLQTIERLRLVFGAEAFAPSPAQLREPHSPGAGTEPAEGAQP